MIIKVKRYNLILSVDKIIRKNDKFIFIGLRLNQNILFDKKPHIKNFKTDLLNKNQYICIG